MKKIIVFAAVVLFLVGFFLSRKKSDIIVAESNESMAERSSAATEGQSQVPVEKREASRHQAPVAYTPFVPKFKFNDDKTFGVASPALDPKIIMAQYPAGMVADGMVIQANFYEIRRAFEIGQVLEFPLFGGQAVTVIPRRAIVDQGNKTTTFVGETEQLSGDTTDSHIKNEVNFIFYEDRITSGEVRVKGELFRITNGREGTFLIKQGTSKIKID